MPNRVVDLSARQPCCPMSENAGMMEMKAFETVPVVRSLRRARVTIDMRILRTMPVMATAIITKAIGVLEKTHQENRKRPDRQFEKKRGEPFVIEPCQTVTSRWPDGGRNAGCRRRRL